MTQHGKIFGGIASPNPREVFLKGDIQDPMDFVFNLPVGAHRLSKLSRIAGQRRDIVANLGGGLMGDGAAGLDHAHRLQTSPFALGIKKGHKFRLRNGPMTTNFQTTVVFLHRLVKIVSHIPKVDLLDIGQQVLNIVTKRALIALES